MLEALKVVILLACTFVGFALIALTQDQHRKRVAAAPALQRRRAWGQRALAAVFLLLALPIALWRDTTSFGAILWVLSLSGGAFLTVAALTWRPQVLKALVAGRP
jgi:hypothetical protein